MSKPVDEGFREPAAGEVVDAATMLARLKDPTYGKPAYAVPAATPPAPASKKARAPKAPAAPAQDKPAKPAADDRWGDANPRIPVGFNFRFNELLHAKAKFVVRHTPDMSLQKLIYQAVEKEVERLLADIDKTLRG